MEGTILTLLPPVVAIILALITKEVYLSLLIGILSGTLLFTGGNPLLAVHEMINIMGSKIGGNVNILIFLVLLGILVSLITKSGASLAYGDWASKTIKTRRGSLLATTFLGMVIFVDDYFNCLTVGTVMRPVTDKYKVSRAKLAYIIDATAAPVCIIAPISSWAAAVGSSLPKDSGIDGFTLFLRTIPFNLYALLTIAFVLYIIIRDKDFSSMRKYNEMVERDGEEKTEEEETIEILGSGKVCDLILPIVTLIVFCIGAMLYTGGIFNGATFMEAFANCDSSTSLVLGSFFTLIVTFILYLPRKVLGFKQFCDSFTQGAKAMVPAVMILSLAWTLSGICSEDYLNIGGFVGSVVGANTTVIALLPCIFFVVAMGLAFATGTSWGTFGILIPIAIGVIGVNDINMLSIAVASILAGAVCGDHISPISDTTILASAGARCNHITHVSTQIPYALCVAVCCIAGYLVSGVTRNGWLGLLTGAVCLLITMFLLSLRSKRAE